MDNAQEATGLIRRIMSDLYALEKLVGTPKTPIGPAMPPKRAERALPEAFEAFWHLYPRKVGKGAAERAWNTHVAKGHGMAIVELLAGQLGQADWVKEGGKYIPYPATWLNQHRWLDEVKGGSDGSGKYGGLGETL